MLHLMTVVYGRIRQKVKENFFICAVGNYKNQIDPQGKTELRRSWWPPRSSILHVYITFFAPQAPLEDPWRGPPSPYLSPSPTLYYWPTGRLQTVTRWGPYCPRRAQPQRDVAGTIELPPLSEQKALGRPGPQSLAPPLRGAGGAPYARAQVAVAAPEAADGGLPRNGPNPHQPLIKHKSGCCSRFYICESSDGS